MAKVATYPEFDGADLHRFKGDKKDFWAFRGGMEWPKSLKGKVLDGLAIKLVELSELHIQDDRTGRNPDSVVEIIKRAIQRV